MSGQFIAVQTLFLIKSTLAIQMYKGERTRAM